jgi:hypothetical protein
LEEAVSGELLAASKRAEIVKAHCSLLEASSSLGRRLMVGQVPLEHFV